MGCLVINLDETHTLNLGLPSIIQKIILRWSMQDVSMPELDTRFGGFEVEYIHHTNFSFQTLWGGQSYL